LDVTITKNQRRKKMKLADLLEEAKAEMLKEDKEVAKEMIKLGLREILETEKLLSEMKEQFSGLLDKDLDDVR